MPTASGPISSSSTVRASSAIDNALSFLPYPRQRTALISLGGSEVPPRLAKRLQDLAADATRMTALQTRLRRLLSEPEVDAFGHRVTELAADPTYPVLDAVGRPAIRVVVRRPAGSAGRLERGEGAG